MSTLTPTEDEIVEAIASYGVRGVFVGGQDPAAIMEWSDDANGRIDALCFANRLAWISGDTLSLHRTEWAKLLVGRPESTIADIIGGLRYSDDGTKDDED